MSRVRDRQIRYRLTVDCVVKAKDLKEAMDAFYMQAIQQIRAQPGRDTVNMSLFMDTGEDKPVLSGQFDLSRTDRVLTVEANIQ